MTIKKRFTKHYQNGFTPWVHYKADHNLIEVVESWPVKPCKVFEPGCGTGTDAIWLAQAGFDVTACDLVEIPLNTARENAKKENVTVEFLHLDFLTAEIKNAPFDFVFDRGYFHSYRTPGKRKKLAKKVASVLTDDGLWLTLVGSCDSPPRKTGPPMRSAKNIVDAVEKYFEIQFLKAGFFGGKHKPGSKLWICLMKKRTSRAC
ncbi:MAG: class I SAM-dependent methyltransferase [Chlorobi bacterium]|nr:class I SAM-dependent methyltransferase [Chlorobiota bacterium]